MIIRFMFPFIHWPLGSDKLVEIALRVVHLGKFGGTLIFRIVMMDNMFFGFFASFQLGLSGIWFDEMTIRSNGTGIPLLEKHLYSNPCSETSVSNESIVSLGVVRLYRQFSVWMSAWAIQPNATLTKSQTGPEVLSTGSTDIKSTTIRLT